VTRSNSKRKSPVDHVKIFLLLWRKVKKIRLHLLILERRYRSTQLRRLLTELEYTTSKKTLINTAKHARDNRIEKVLYAVA
jgi:hypothetical protein